MTVYEMAIGYVERNVGWMNENPYVMKLLKAEVQNAYIEGYRKAERDYEKQIMNYREKN